MSSVAATDSRPDRLAWSLLPARDIRPRGWLLHQLREDFTEGLPGRLDTINQDVAHATFAHRDRAITSSGRPSWWPAEQEGYWHESFIHCAFFLDDATAIRRATTYVESILASQEPDGYLGIYLPEARPLPTDLAEYGKLGGEFHVQARLFLALLAFHEHTGRHDALDAVTRAVALLIAHYPEGPFGLCHEAASQAGGYGHAISVLDPLLQLYRITGDETYLHYCAKIATGYNRFTPRDRDLTDRNIDDPAVPFVGHGVHTAESLALHHVLALLDSDPSRGARTLEKLSRHTVPGGALISDELVGGQLGSGHALYEYCAQAELMKSFLWISQCTGRTEPAAAAAHLFLNAVQGARLHPLIALQYLSRDDRADIPFQREKDAVTITGSHAQFQMSSIIRPTCCSASSGRPLAYFLCSSWARHPSVPILAVLHFAPTAIATQVGGVSVRVEQLTAYPFSDDIAFVVAVDAPVAFSIAVPLPADGQLNTRDAAGATVIERDGFRYFEKRWQTGDRIELQLDLPVRLEPTADGQARFYRRGPLVFALPLAEHVSAVQENPRWDDGSPAGLFEYDIKVEETAPWDRRIIPGEKFHLVHLDGDPLRPWQAPEVGLRGAMADAEGRRVEVTLVPQGAAVCRRVPTCYVLRHLTQRRRGGGSDRQFFNAHRPLRPRIARGRIPKPCPGRTCDRFRQSRAACSKAR